jgi:hypothetical protein
VIDNHRKALAMTSTQRITTSLAVALALAASAAPASASPNHLPSAEPAVPAYASHTSSDPSATAPPTIVRLTAPSSGFDWGDAGIGAAGGFALSMIGLGGALVVSGQRPRRARPAKTVIS